MTERQISLWIKEHLGDTMAKAIKDSKTMYTPDWLGAMAQREVGFLIARYVSQKKTFKQICELMIGDYNRRPLEREKQYHGYSYWQLDINTHLPFIKTGEWKNPYKACMKAIETLEDKRAYLEKFVPGIVNTSVFDRAITAAYNCGAGNVAKAYKAGLDVDIYTHQHNYSQEVWRFREIYKSL